jgi:hypothetical protein
MRGVPIDIKVGRLPTRARTSDSDVGAYGRLEIRDGEPERLKMYLSPEVTRDPKIAEVFFVHEAVEAGERLRVIQKHPPSKDTKGTEYLPPTRSEHKKALKVTETYAKEHDLPTRKSVEKQVWG